jgi:hypothetical protein
MKQLARWSPLSAIVATLIGLVVAAAPAPASAYPPAPSTTIATTTTLPIATTTTIQSGGPTTTTIRTTTTIPAITTTTSLASGGPTTTTIGGGLPSTGQDSFDVVQAGAIALLVGASFVAVASVRRRQRLSARAATTSK